MKKNTIKIQWYGFDLENGKAKIPKISSSDMDKLEGLLMGELYICAADESPAIFIRTDKDRVVAIGGGNLEELKNLFLSRQTDDEASGLIKFLQGIISLGDIVAKSGITIGENGSGISVLPDGKSQAVVDYLYVKVKAIFDELEVKKKTYVGGEQILSPAGMKCIKVEELPDAYRCFFKAEEDGVEIENQFTVGTFAISQECNIKVGVSHNVGNRYYWREVTSVGVDYIDLSKTKCDLNIENDIPASGDDIVALGHSTDITRQGAIILSSANEVAPSILMYQGINDFTLVGKEVIGFDFDKATGKARMRVYGDTYIGAKDESEYISYKDGKVNIKGTMHIEPGSTGFDNVTGMEFGKVNLLRNSGFTGDYNSAKLEESTELEEETDLYSQALKFWAATNATVNSDTVSHSGRSVTLNTGILVQTLYYKMIEGEKYIISFRAKGSSVSVSCAGLEKTERLTSAYQKFVYKFDATPDTEFTVSGSCTICELQLERGTVPSEWSISPLDNNSAEAKFEALKYLTDVIREGSTSFIGGLGLLSMILVGNYSDGEMKQVTGGLSGVYNDGDDPLLWGDGDLEKAIRTVMACKDNPNAFLDMSEEELANYAKIVLTHGGRAILNDVVLRGYVYALGGVFKGKVEVAGGKILLNEDGSGQLANGALSWDKTGTLYRKSREIILWRRIFEEMTAAGITESYDINLSSGTFLFTVGNSDSYINLPPPDEYKEISLDVQDPPRTRVPLTFITVKCGSSPILKYNSETSGYEEVMLGEPKGGNGVITSMLYEGQYRWIATVNFGKITIFE